jgi:hypothetical protein
VLSISWEAKRAVEAERDRRNAERAAAMRVVK